MPKATTKVASDTKKPEVAAKSAKASKPAAPVVEDKVESKLAPPKKIIG